MSNLHELDHSEPAPPRRDVPQFIKDGGLITERYQVRELIGRGGFGEVYRATDLLLKRQVAVKILYRKDETSDDLHEQNQSRFLNEARITAQLKHPALPVTYDFGTLPQGELFLVCELLQGLSLTEKLKQNKLAPLEALSMLEQVTGAIQIAHERGVLHRDIKPSNIFWVEGQHAEVAHYKVLDFGIAKQAEESDLTGLNLEETQVGGVIGSVRYLSPERLTPNSEYGPPSDLYSLGVVFFIALTQRLPYRGASMFDVGLQHLTAPIPQVEVPDILPAQRELLQSLINDLLAKSPQDRIQTAAELGDRITSLRAEWLTLAHLSESSLGGETLTATDAVHPALSSPTQKLSSHLNPPHPPLHTKTQPVFTSASPSRSRGRGGLSYLMISVVAALIGAIAWWGVDDAPAPESVAVDVISTAASHQDRASSLTTEAELSRSTRDQADKRSVKPLNERRDQRASKKSKESSERSSERSSKTSTKRRLVDRRARSKQKVKRPAQPKTSSSKSGQPTPQITLTFSLTPLKATYLKTDRISLNVKVNGGPAGEASKVKCQLTPTSLGQVRGRRLQLKGAGRGVVSCCVGATCKRRKLMVLDELLNEF